MTIEIILKIFKQTLAILAVLGAISGGSSQRNLGEYTSPAELTYIETSAEQQENMLLFDNLTIELPKGVTVEIEPSDNDDADVKVGQIIKLNGAQKIIGDADSYRGTGPFPPKISIAHYAAEYECEEGLISAFLDLFSGENLRVQYEDEENSEYVFRLGNWDYENAYYYYAFVRGEDIYLVGEFDSESGYSFSALRDKGKVKWQDSGKSVGKDKNLHISYFKITPEESRSFLCRDGSSDLYFYFDGYFDNCYTSHETGRSSGYLHSSDLIDINFDGYTDIDLSSTEALVWNTIKKDFIRFEYPEDMPYSFSLKRFSETKTIWGYDSDYLSDLWDSHSKDYTESLWQWKGFTLVKKRECRAEIREDGVRIWAYEDTADNIMFDERFTLEEWDDDSNKGVQALYKQFYDGLAPVEVFFTEVDDGQEKIPQGLLDKIMDAMINSTELETLKAMMNSVKLTDEEIYVAADKNADIRNNVLQGYQSGSYILAAADVDNDGIEDIIGEFYWGGTGGFVDYILFKGQADGTYKETDSFSSVKEEFGVIAYKGKNYLVRTLYDYGKKFYNGFCVTVYEDGTLAEEVYLMLYPDDFDLAIESCEEGYGDYAAEVMGDAAAYNKTVADYECVLGSAEELAEDNDEYKYKCDLDNDGEQEYYNKNIWTSSNSYTTDALSFMGDDEAIDLIRDTIAERYWRDDYYNDIMLWADVVGKETVVSVMYQTGLEDFVIVGYVVNGSECREVYEISADAVMGVEQSRARGR